jgi:hypothetical protein
MVAATIFAGVAPTQEEKVQALVDHLVGAWCKAVSLDEVVDDVTTRLPPVPHYEGANVRDATSGRLIVHDTAGAHSDDPRAVSRCRVCNPER